MGKEHIGQIDFLKMSGAGNDFVVIDNRSELVKDPSMFARIICDRRRGVGADGILLLEKSARSDFLMRYYNADGTYGGMCGNGGRCISRYAYLKGIVSATEMNFEALDHIYHAQIINDDVKLSMKNPVGIRTNQMLPISGKKILFHYIDTGSPHCVIFLEENKEMNAVLRDLNVQELGKAIRHDKYFSPKGTNVNFVERRDSTTFAIRTYERGVEAETLACGTGSVASALLANHVFGVKSPLLIKTQSGEELQVEFDDKGPSGYQHVSLFGSAHVTFDGRVHYNPSLQTIHDLP